MDISQENISPELLDSIQYLARIAAVLDVSCVPRISDIIDNAGELLDRHFENKRTMITLQSTEEAIRDNIVWARHERALVEGWTARLRYGHDEDIVASQREKDMIVRKGKEYRKELEMLTATLPAGGHTLQDVITLHEENRRKERILQKKRAKIKAFQGLPPNLERAKEVLRAAQSEQHALSQLRERLLRQMVDHVS